MRIRGLMLATLLAVLGMVGVAFANVGDVGGTSWRVVAYNIGQHNNLTHVSNNNEILVNFGQNGRVTGHGQSSFAANYSVMRGQHRIHISNPGMTARNVSQRSTAATYEERAIMQAFRNATHFRMAGGQLDLLYSDGRIAATLLTTNEQAVIARRAELLGNSRIAVASVPSSANVIQLQSVSSATVRTYTVYRAGTREARIERMGNDAVMMTIDGETFRLTRVVSPEGVRYVAVNDPQTVLWERDGKSTIVIRGQEYPEFIEVR